MQIQPIAEVHHRATKALIRELGVVDTIRFLNQFRTGQGNYTAEREQLLKHLTVKEIAEKIKSQRP